MKKNCMQTCQVVIEKHSDDLCIMNTHHINPVLRNSILTGVHAKCMQAASTAVKMKLVRTSFDWSYQVVLIHLPISAYFFTSFILPPFTPCAISDSCFFLHQRLLYPQMGKFKSHLCHVKNLHVDLSKFEVTETQKRCRIFYEKEEVLTLCHGLMVPEAQLLSLSHFLSLALIPFICRG